ncbi:MAG: bifunctional oligoribonuclease/PAP phosphatase NrnA [Clostridia bacterium]
MTLDSIINEINNAKTLVILTHMNPDGDAIGSSLALYCSLLKLKKDVDVIVPEHSSIYNFLPRINDLKKEPTKEQYDIAIALDCGDIKRLNGFSESFENAKCKISIDHHEINTMFADYNFVNPASPACAQILITVIEALGVEIDNEIGTCLLTGILTDTGGFKYPATSAETFEFTAELLRKGVKVSDIYKRVLQTISKKSFELRKVAINRLELLENGKIAFTYITNKDMETVEAEEGDHEGIVDIGRDIEGVEVSIFLKETEDGTYKISLRSNEYVNVADIALLFNGGGHIRAAGGSITGTIEQSKERLVAECKKHLK